MGFLKITLSSFVHPCGYQRMNLSTNSSWLLYNPNWNVFSDDQRGWVVRSPKSIWNLNLNPSDQFSVRILISLKKKKKVWPPGGNRGNRLYSEE